MSFKIYYFIVITWMILIDGTIFTYHVKLPEKFNAVRILVWLLLMVGIGYYIVQKKRYNTPEDTPLWSMILFLVFGIILGILNILWFY